MIRKIDKTRLPDHIGIIMDGNGRWAKKRLLSRVFGHKKGSEAVRVTVEVARKIGIKYLTLYAFSTENWSRPQKEIDFLMVLLGRFLKSELSSMQKNGIKLNIIGKIEKFSSKVKKELAFALEQTKNNKTMVLTLALGYGGQDEIVNAVNNLLSKGKKGIITSKDLSKQLYTHNLPDPDLIIRTSGEKRLSNFLLWQSAYSELWFTDVLWPDFDKQEFMRAIYDYSKRKRRFGDIQE